MSRVSFRAWVALIFLCAFGAGFGVTLAINTDQELATAALTIPILVIAGLTLWFTVPKAARIAVDKMDEIDSSDLIFFIYPDPNPSGAVQQPGDYLLQLEVAVSNVGARKAILSGIRVDGFCNDRKEIVHLPDAPESIGGMRWLQQSGWVNDRRHFQNITDPPPYVLDRDEAIVIRFRARRGIDWSERWKLDALGSFTDPLRRPIVSAFGTVVWRKGREVIREPFVVELKVEKQREYVQLVDKLTDNLSMIPTGLPNLPLALE